MLRNCFGDDWIDGEMRIAECMHVARSARDICRHVHETNPLRSLHASRLADFDLGIARVLQKRRQPSKLELRATIDQDVSIPQRDNEARPRIDEVGIFRSFGQNDEVNLVSADFASERAEVRQSRDYAEFCLSRRQCSEY